MVLRSHSGGRLGGTSVAGVDRLVCALSPGHGSGGHGPLRRRGSSVVVGSSAGSGAGWRGSCGGSVTSDGKIPERFEGVLSRGSRRVNGEDHSLTTVASLAAVEPEGGTVVVRDVEVEGREWVRSRCNGNTEEEM